MPLTNRSTAKFATSISVSNWFRYLVEAKIGIDQWRRHYTDVRPHCSLAYLTPLESKATCAASFAQGTRRLRRPALAEATKTRRTNHVDRPSDQCGFPVMTGP